LVTFPAGFGLWISFESNRPDFAAEEVTDDPRFTGGELVTQLRQSIVKIAGVKYSDLKKP